MRVSVLNSLVLLAVVWTALRLHVPQRVAVQRLVLYVIPGVAVVAAGLTAAAVLEAPYFEWNDPRLAVTAAVFEGHPMYAAADRGPLLGHVYGPVSPVIYAPALLMSTPGAAIAAGSLLAFLVMTLPALWVITSAGSRDRSLVVLVCVTFWMYVLASRILLFTGFSIHADAPALGFGALACGLVYSAERRARPAALFASALAMALAVGSKQVIAPVLLVVPLWVGLMDGWTALRRYLAISACAAIVVLIALTIFVDVRAMVFNAIEVPGGYPLKPNSVWSLFMRATQDLAPRMVPFALIAGIVASLDWNGTAGWRVAPRQWLRAHPWMLFVLLSGATIPLSMVGRSVMGGSLNALSYPLYFLTLAALLALLQLSRERRPVLEAPARSLVAFTLALMAGGMAVAQTPRLAALPEDLRTFARNPEDEMFRAVREQPGEIYLPFMPLVSLMGEDGLYHFSYALYDRQLADRPVSEEHFRAHLPPRLTYVAAYRLPMAHYHSTAYLPEFTREVHRPDLADWTIVARATHQD